MDRPRENDHLGVNKIGKNIRKCPLHQQPSLAAHANLAAAERPQPHPQVYNINRNDFRSIVQQLTGSLSHESLPRPPQNNSPKPQNTRLQRIRPSPLAQINRPAMAPLQHHPHSLMRPPPSRLGMPQGTQQQPMMGQGDQFWSNTAESTISEYMRYLQSSFGDGNHMQPCLEHRPYMPAHEQQLPYHENRPYMSAQPQSQPQPYMSAQRQPQPYMPAQRQSQHQPQCQPESYIMPGPQPQMNTHGPLQPSQYLPQPGLVPSPMAHNLPPHQFNGHVPVTPTLPSPSFNQMYGSLPSPQYNGFGQLHSSTSQFGLPSPTSYPNMYSPRSPYPLLSPEVQYPQPLTPNFSFSQLAQSGSLGPGAGSGPPQPPPSPGLVFPLSPGLFPVPSPRWGDY
ncbi:hypothetical protein N665_0212s0002 [Sinapis alba]|nr:hypothetical protein N665_0212s0002 [Sinapis alba]